MSTTFLARLPLPLLSLSLVLLGEHFHEAAHAFWLINRVVVALKFCKKPPNLATTAEERSFAIINLMQSLQASRSSIDRPTRELLRNSFNAVTAGRDTSWIGAAALISGVLTLRRTFIPAVYPVLSITGP
jgi:hypothetical protein